MIVYNEYVLSERTRLPALRAAGGAPPVPPPVKGVSVDGTLDPLP